MRLVDPVLAGGRRCRRSPAGEHSLMSGCMKEILVTGGTGVLGSHVVRRLREIGYAARVLSRRGGAGTIRGNLASGQGVEAAVRGVGTVIHCASSPFFGTRRTDVHGTARLVAASRRAGVSHLVFVSIVGIDRTSGYPYYRAKLDAEREIERSGLPYTILRATQFYDLVLKVLRFLDRGPVMLIPNGFPGQAIDSAEVAAHLVELARGAPAGRAPDVGGPEIRTLTDAAREYLRHRHSRKRVIPLRLPGRTARAMRAGALTCPDNRFGRRHWTEFLEAHVR